MSHWDKYLFCINISLGCQNAVFLIHAERFNSKRRLSFETVFELHETPAESVTVPRVQDFTRDCDLHITWWLLTQNESVPRSYPYIIIHIHICSNY